MLTLNEDNFRQEVLEEEVPILVDFYADWCRPCRFLENMLKKVTTIKIGRVNVDENSNLSNDYNIRALPTMLFFKNGQVIAKLVGVQSEQVLMETVDEVVK